MKKLSGLLKVLSLVTVLLLVFSLAACGDEKPVDEKYTVTISADIAHGEIESDYAKTTAGTLVTLTVTPSKGYELKSLKYNQTEITEKDGKYSFEMPAENVVIYAEFTAILYSISVDDNIENGSVTVEKTQAAAGEEVVVGVNADVGYILEENSLKYNQNTINSYDGVYKFVMPGSAVTITAEFVMADYAVNVSGGKINGGASFGEFEHGYEITLTPDIPVGNDFVGWYEVNGDEATLLSEEMTFTYTVTKSVNLVAKFKLKQFEVEVIDGTSDKEIYNYGETATITPGVKAGKEFMFWYVGDVEDDVKEAGDDSKGGAYSFTVTEAGMSFTAHYQDTSGNYEKDLHTVDAFGMLGEGEYFEGEEVTITFVKALAPEEIQEYIADGKKYILSGIIYNGENHPLTDGETFTFTMGNVNIELEPYYTETEYGSYTVVTGEHATGGGAYESGATVTLTEVGYSDYVTFVGWKDVSGAFGEPNAIISSEPTYAFTMPNKDVEIVPQYKFISSKWLGGTDDSIYDNNPDDGLGNGWLAMDRYFHSMTGNTAKYGEKSAWDNADLGEFKLYIYKEKPVTGEEVPALTLNYVLIDNVTCLVTEDGANVLKGVPVWKANQKGAAAFNASNYGGTVAQYKGLKPDEVLFAVFLYNIGFDLGIDITDSAQFNAEKGVQLYTATQLIAKEGSNVTDGDIHFNDDPLLITDDNAVFTDWKDYLKPQGGEGV